MELSSVNVLLDMLKPYLSVKEPKTGQTLLMKLTISNENYLVVQYLLGAKYDPTE